jgi:purine nucleoside permease
MRICQALFGLLLVWAVAAVGAPPAPGPKPIEVRMVVVTMFEIGADTGDTPGEFQLWYERQKLDKRFPFAHHHDLFMNEHSRLLVMVTGEGTANSASSVMELGLDPRFDLTHAYWLVAGIAGVDPEDASIGSAACRQAFFPWNPAGLTSPTRVLWPKTRSSSSIPSWSIGLTD